MKKTIFLILAIIGFLIVVGTVGAYENDTISNKQYIVQSVIGLILVIIPIVADVADVEVGE